MATAFKACSIHGCNGNASWTAKGARGYCCSHYKRLCRHGDPLAGGTRNGAPRQFIDDVVLNFDGDDCLIWPFNRNNMGYGKIYDKPKMVLAHRFICEMVHGSQPDKLRREVAHRCGKGHLGCVNPRHLYWASRSENMLDRNGHGTSNRGEQHGASKLTSDDVRRMRAMVGSRSYQAIADDFGVDIKTVWSAINGKSWAWLK